jgi:Putative peptidoglycan binding domain
MSWFLAPSLRALFAEVNRTAPRRNKRSDGSVGDTSHQARKSDHNPDRGAGGVVRAIDVTHDPGGGCDCNRLASRIRARRDPRVAYIIWNRRIMAGHGGPSPWVWRRYNGVNPHSRHMHVSIRHSRAAQNDVRAWLGGSAVSLAAGPVSPVRGKRKDGKPWYPGLRKIGMHGKASGPGAFIAMIQKRLNEWEVARPPLKVDGDFGTNTRDAVAAFQRKRGIAPVTGAVGPRTWYALFDKPR